MPKSRGRKPARKPARHPRRPARARGAAELCWLRLRHVLRQDAAEPLQVTAVPALFLDAIAAEHGLPAERCLDDCLSLACAYAQLGMPAQVRAAELVITVPDGRRATHGTLAPRWEDGMIHGHAVVWLPGPGHLVDVTAGQFPLIAAEGLGPVIAAGIMLPRPASQADGTDRVGVIWGDLQLAYTLAPMAVTAAMLDSPVMADPDRQPGRHGMNLATETVRLLAERLPARRLAMIPHPRAAALALAVRDLPGQQDESRDWQFILPGPVTARLDQIPLPDGTPPPATPGTG